MFWHSPQGNVTKFYMYNEEGSRTSHKDGNGVWYVNIRDPKGYRKEIVPANEIYELKQEYHTSKSNPKFSRAITTIKGYAEKEPRPFYVVTYQWADGADQRFDLPRHGNATKPTVANTTGKIPVFSQRSIIWSVRDYQRIKFITPLPELELVRLVKLYLVPS